MTILQIVGALMIVAFFAAIFVLIFVIEGDWKVPAAVFVVVVLAVAFLGLASALLTGDIA